MATPNAPVEIDVQFSEAMRTKIRNESRLKLRETDPDVVFSGQITGYRVTAEAPKEGNTVALNKLEIVVQVQYTNHKNEKENYSRSYSFFRTFEADQDLQTVQEALNKDIINQLTEKIFNETFASW
ncbi:MAG: LptE family protein [Saprospiraceae bacterium]|nr:LptE family protein [Saprospiraceae bacterium]